MLGDNKSAVDSSATPHRKTQAMRAASSFNRLRETVAVGMAYCCFTRGSLSPADILSKNWSQDYFWWMLQLLMFWKGDIAEIM